MTTPESNRLNYDFRAAPNKNITNNSHTSQTQINLPLHSKEPVKLHNNTRVEETLGAQTAVPGYTFTRSAHDSGAMYNKHSARWPNTRLKGKAREATGTRRAFNTLNSPRFVRVPFVLFTCVRIDCTLIARRRRDTCTGDDDWCWCCFWHSSWQTVWTHGHACKSVCELYNVVCQNMLVAEECSAETNTTHAEHRRQRRRRRRRVPVLVPLTAR